MKGYKVVSNVIGRYYSAVIIGELGKEYFPEKFIRANHTMERKGYGLTFFQDLSEAKIFAKCNQTISFNFGRLEVWEIEAEGVFSYLPFNRLYKFTTKIPTIKQFRNSAKKLLSGRWAFGEWPKGTKMARHIKLIRRVK
jgi:hypothetical protein